MDKKTLLSILDINVFYGGFHALWNISLEVREKEIVALIGANGSGKSTLLNTISGFCQPKGGKIEFEGKDITGLDPYKIVEFGISLVPEGRRVFPELSVIDNLILGSYPALARKKREENLRFVYELFPILKERKSQLAKTLSGGEQQMLAIGRGLMSNPKLLLLDEMSLGLAPIAINIIYKALKQIKEKGISILLVEQNVKRSLDEADRAYILEAGKIVISGSAIEIKEHEEIKKAYFGL